jgi:uncharacterized protein YjcR
MRKKHVFHSPAQKIAVLQDITCGKTVVDIAESYSISKSVIQSWKEKYSSVEQYKQHLQAQDEYKKAHDELKLKQLKNRINFLQQKVDEREVNTV